MTQELLRALAVIDGLPVPSMVPAGVPLTLSDQRPYTVDDGVIVMGMVFEQLDRIDAECFSGADPCSLIHYGHLSTFILDPSGAIFEIPQNEEAAGFNQRTWTSQDDI